MVGFAIGQYVIVYEEVTTIPTRVLPHIRLHISYSISTPHMPSKNATIGALKIDQQHDERSPDCLGAAFTNPARRES